MQRKHFFTSLTRIADFQDEAMDVRPLARDEWTTGDYVVGEVTFAAHDFSRIEGTDGRHVEVVLGDLVVGALGRRAATLSAVGDWRLIESNGAMDLLTAAGLMGRASSISWQTPPLMGLAYRGHVFRNEAKVGMGDFVHPPEAPPYDRPTILIIGTSMEAGKTTSAKVIIRRLGAAGRRVVGTKLTGAGRYRDVLAMRDAGADAVYDFVDGGLPSSVCPQPEYRKALSAVLAMISAQEPDVVVAEAGASPLEPYNGATLMAEIGKQVRCTVLCASDPYAVVGVVQGFGIVPDIVSGVAADTTAGIELIRRLTGLEALDLRDRRSHPRLEEILFDRLDGSGGRGPAPAERASRGA